MVSQSRIAFLVCLLFVASGLLLLDGCDNPAGSDDVGQLPGTNDPPGGDDPPAGPPAQDPPADEGPPDELPEVVQLVTSIDFESEVPGYTGGPFDGSGSDEVPAAGQLDADAWSFTGFSDGDRAFGEPGLGGDFARGRRTGSVSTGGLYSFAVEEENHTLGVQATSSDFAPGSIALRVPAPEGTIRSIDIQFVWWVHNDQDRSTSLMSRYSTDGQTWMEVGSAFDTPELADSEPTWTAAAESVSVDLSDGQTGTTGFLYLAWDAADGAGTGSRDEFALDDIRVTFNYIAE